MKKNYFDDEKTNKKSKRKKKKGKMSAGKVFLIIIAIIVLGLAAFLGTIKLIEPDYDLTQLIPDKAMSAIKENVLKQTAETTQTTTEATTLPKPTRPVLDYLEDSEFKMDTAKQGNFLGNLLNGGKVGEDGTYIYHIVDGKGIYRFAPNTESYSLYYESTDTLSSLNLRGDYLYFVDETSGALLKLQKGSKTPKTVAENVKFAYVYDQTVYFITNENALCVMDAKELTPTTAYYSADSELQLIGISKERIFFSVRDGNYVEFLTVDNYAKSEACEFREALADDSESNFVMENGFLYYIKNNNGYSVIRQKFGSQKTFELAKTNSNIGYPITVNNRLFYSDMEDNKLLMNELNMNSDKTKTMIKSAELDGTYNIAFFHGGEYDFIIGEGQYRASSNLTSSTNVMKFKDGRWSY